MKLNADQIQSSKNVLRTYLSYFALLEKHLGRTKHEISETVAKLMQATMEMDSDSTEGKSNAEKLIEDASLNPTDDMQNAISESNSNVDDIMEAALSGEVHYEATEITEIENAQKRRQGGKFSKAVEGMHMLEANLSKIIMELMGSLSLEDVVGQKVDAINKSVAATAEIIGLKTEQSGSIFLAPTAEESFTKILDSVEKFSHSTEESAHLEEYFKHFNLNAGCYTDEINSAAVAETFRFFQQYIFLVSENVLAIRKNISNCLTVATTSVMNLASGSDKSIAHSDELLLGENREKAKSIKKVEEMERKKLQDLKNDSGGSMDFISKSLHVPTDMLAALDSNMSQKMFDMIAALSVDDVIGQRLDHVIKELEKMAKFIGHFQGDPENNLCLDIVKKTTHDLLQSYFDDYTSQEEKQDFTMVYKKVS